MLCHTIAHGPERDKFKTSKAKIDMLREFQSLILALYKINLFKFFYFCFIYLFGLPLIHYNQNIQNACTHTTQPELKQKKNNLYYNFQNSKSRKTINSMPNEKRNFCQTRM